MSSVKIHVMYGHLEGAGKDFARDPTGFLSIEAGIFQKHGLDVSWEHVQGTEERYRRLANGSAQISLVVGRASLQHFLTSKSTRILGCAMNSCAYFLNTAPSIGRLADLKGKVVGCREGPSRQAPIAPAFYEIAKLRVGVDLTLQLLNGDHDAFQWLTDGRAEAALLPRPFALIAEATGFRRIKEWPEVVDDPLPITIETTEKLWRERESDMKTFLVAHGEGIRHFKSHPVDGLRILQRQFGHAPALAGQIFKDYIGCLDETLYVDFKHFEKLLSQIAFEKVAESREVAAEWIVSGRLKG